MKKRVEKVETRRSHKRKEFVNTIKGHKRYCINCLVEACNYCPNCEQLISMEDTNVCPVCGKELI